MTASTVAQVATRDSGAPASHFGVDGLLFAAPVTPFDEAGHPDLGACSAYYEHLIDDGADGLAIAVHSGRGGHLSIDERQCQTQIAAELGVPVIAGVGVTTSEDEEWARRAGTAGADALLVLPSCTEREQAVRDHLKVGALSELPLIAFDLYSRPFDDEAFKALMDLEVIHAAKIARLSDAIVCQRRISLAHNAGKLVLTGEDRMFGPSLLWGSDAAVVGLGAASAKLCAEAWHAFRAADFARFVSACARLDAFAAITFAEPYDGYVQRMAWIAAEEGLIPHRSSYDPLAPPLDRNARDRVLRGWQAIMRSN